MIQVTEEFFEIIRNSHQITTLMVFFDWDESVTFDISDYDHLKTYEPDMKTPITPATYDGIQADYADYDTIRHYVGSGGNLVTTGTVAKAVSGSVTADRTAKARRTFSAEIALHSWEDIPVDIIKSRVQIWTGVYMGSMSMMVPVGVFRVDSISRINTGTLSLGGSSLEEFVIQDQWTEAGTLTKGIPIISTIQSIVNASVPGDVDWRITPEAQGRDEPLPYDTPYEVGDSKWDAIESLAFDIECDVYCDATGTFVIDERPNFSKAKPVAVIHEGADGVLMELNTQSSRDEMFNAVVAMGEGDNPHSHVEVHDDPTSALRWGGPFGKRPTTYTSKLLDTKQKCEDKAKAMLAEALAESRTLNFSAIPNPALEPDDVVAISMLDGTYEDHLLTKIQIPFGLGDWSADTLSVKDRDSVLNPDRPIDIDPAMLGV